MKAKTVAINRPWGALAAAHLPRAKTCHMLSSRAVSQYWVGPAGMFPGLAKQALGTSDFLFREACLYLAEAHV